MKTLPNNDSNENQSNDSSDVRHKARVTPEQQQHIDELSKLEQSFKEKESPKNIKTEDEPQHGEGKEGATRQKERKVDVSRKKSILKIIADTFTVAVNPKEWKKIIESLKNLFVLRTKEIGLIRDIAHNNKLISSLLAREKKEEIETAMRIADLLRRVERGVATLSIANLGRIAAIQASLIADLGKAFTKIAQPGELIQTQIKHLLAPSTAEQMEKIKSLAAGFLQSQDKNVFSSGTIITQPTTQNMSTQLQYYAINPIQVSTSQTHITLTIMNGALNLVKSAAETLLLNPMRHAFMDLFFGNHHHNYGNKNCTQYAQNGPHVIPCHTTPQPRQNLDSNHYQQQYSSPQWGYSFRRVECTIYATPRSTITVASVSEITITAGYSQQTNHS